MPWFVTRENASTDAMVVINRIYFFIIIIITSLRHHHHTHFMTVTRRSRLQQGQGWGRGLGTYPNSL
jgi:hypothetical protein